MCRDIRAQSRHRFRELVAAPWCFAEPERNRRRHTARILDVHNPALNALDPVALVAELKDVASEALDREILVDRTDEMVLGFEQHLIVGIIRDGAAGGERRQPRAPRRPRSSLLTPS